MKKLRFAYKQSDFNSTVTYEMIQQAKRYIIKEANSQHSEFLQESMNLKRGGTVAKSSKTVRFYDATAE